MAVSGISSIVPEENSGENREKIAGKLSRIATSLESLDFGHRETQTCRETWVDTAVRGVFFGDRQLQPS